MNKLILPVMLLLLSACSHHADKTTTTDPSLVAPDDSCYICTGSHARTSHIYRDCKGLNMCGSEIILVHRAEADRMRRRPCRRCDRRLLDSPD